MMPNSYPFIRVIVRDFLRNKSNDEFLDYDRWLFEKLNPLGAEAINCGQDNGGSLNLERGGIIQRQGGVKNSQLP